MIYPESWRILPLHRIMAILAVLPPPPVQVGDQTVAFVDPNAAKRLHEIRDGLMAALAETKAIDIDAMCRAHDAEDCAQRGEPDPWADWMVREHIEQNGQAAHDEWVAERRAAMLCALKAVGLA